MRTMISRVYHEVEQGDLLGEAVMTSLKMANGETAAKLLNALNLQDDADANAVLQHFGM